MMSATPRYANRISTPAIVAIAVIITFGLSGCRKDKTGDPQTRSGAPCPHCAPAPATGEAVIYTALDQEFSETLIQQFSKDKTIKVRSIYDTESNKSVGLTARILLEQKDPQTDLFWNNEILNTIRLVRAGSIAPLPKSLAVDPGLRGGTHYRSFAARARVVAVRPDALPKFTTYDANDPDNRKLTDQFPALENWPAKGAFPDGIRVAIALPVAGTTATHLAVLRARLGTDKTREWLEIGRAHV